MKKEIKGKAVTNLNEDVTIESKKRETVEVKENTLTVIPKVEPTLEEKNKILEAEIVKLKAKLTQTPQTLEEKIKFYQVKQEKVKQLYKLDKYSKELCGHVEKIEKLVCENDFECDKYTLLVNDKSESYRGEDIFQMNNPLLIYDVIKFILQRIEEKMNVLKLEIAE